MSTCRPFSAWNPARVIRSPQCSCMCRPSSCRRFAAATWPRSSTSSSGVPARKRGNESSSAITSSPPGPQRSEGRSEGPAGVGHVVHRGGGPDHVGRPEIGPGLVEVSLDGTDPVPQACGVGPAPQVGQHLRGYVDGCDRGAGQVPGEGDGAGAAARPEIDDAGPVRGLAADPARSRRGGTRAGPRRPGRASRSCGRVPCVDGTRGDRPSLRHEVRPVAGASAGSSSCTSIPWQPTRGIVGLSRRARSTAPGSTPTIRNPRRW